jgi:hypothetical protein
MSILNGYINASGRQGHIGAEFIVRGGVIFHPFFRVTSVVSPSLPFFIFAYSGLVRFLGILDLLVHQLFFFLRLDMQVPLLHFRVLLLNPGSMFDLNDHLLSIDGSNHTVKSTGMTETACPALNSIIVRKWADLELFFTGEAADHPQGIVTDT